MDVPSNKTSRTRLENNAVIGVFLQALFMNFSGLMTVFVQDALFEFFQIEAGLFLFNCKSLNFHSYANSWYSKFGFGVIIA
ncbi:MAG: hypothetical protein R6U85_12370 [Salinivirgaceae bacterium]